MAFVEYIVPKNCPPKVTMGVMDKAPRDKGGIFSNRQGAGAVPGPQDYFKDPAFRSFGMNAPGGRWSRHPRNVPNAGQSGSAEVGKYDTEASSALTSPRTRGGVISSTPRGCAHIDRVVNASKWKPSPGQYDAELKAGNVYTPRFAEARTISKVPKTVYAIGPGHYNPQMQLVEPTPPSYSAPKDAGVSYLDKHARGLDKLPAPGQFGIPETKQEDVVGRQLHSARILADRIISPR